MIQATVNAAQGADPTKMNPQELISNYEAKMQNFFHGSAMPTTDFQDPDQQ